MSDNLNVRVVGELRQHVMQQIGEQGLYDNASEYIRDLIRKDLTDKQASWEWLRKHLEPAMRADASEFVAVTAADVISRNG
jgi:Arc/MetJ-type ribon-helix-helix transcriptional regulator